MRGLLLEILDLMDSMCAQSLYRASLFSRRMIRHLVGRGVVS
jgi:hypothetical protein